jgi:cytochrome c-type biogenesis protein CcmF
VPFGPLLAWKRGDIYGAAQRLMVAFGAALVGVVLVLVLAGYDEMIAAFGIGVAIWLIVGALSELATRAQLGQRSLGVSLARLAGLPRSAFGMTLAHLGVGLTLLGVISSTTWNEETIIDMTPGETIVVGGKSVTYDGVSFDESGNYQRQLLTFTVREGDRVITTIEPEKRFYEQRETATTEAGIRTFGFSQLYVSPGDLTPDGVLTVRAFWKPLVTLIWLGAVVMAIGGVLSLSDRRLRVGAPKPARGGRVVAPAE